MDLDVALVQWPVDENRRRELAGLGRPRLLLVEPSAAPPVCVDHLEDWVRLPASRSETRARVDALLNRVQSSAHYAPRMDDGGTVFYGAGRIDLPEMQGRLMRPLIDNFEAVVSREQLMRNAWPQGHTDPNNLDVQIGRLRRRVKPHGLRIRTVRSRGYLLTASESARPS